MISKPKLNGKIATLRAKVLLAAKKWYDADLTDCENGRKCKKHGGVCQLMYAVRDLIEYEKNLK